MVSHGVDCLMQGATRLRLALGFCQSLEDVLQRTLCSSVLA
jgi:hypothetical protein